MASSILYKNIIINEGTEFAINFDDIDNIFENDNNNDSLNSSNMAKNPTKYNNKNSENSEKNPRILHLRNMAISSAFFSFI